MSNRLQSNDASLRPGQELCACSRAEGRFVDVALQSLADMVAGGPRDDQAALTRARVMLKGIQTHDGASVTDLIDALDVGFEDWYGGCDSHFEQQACREFLDRHLAALRRLTVDPILNLAAAQA